MLRALYDCQASRASEPATRRRPWGGSTPCHRRHIRRTASPFRMARPCFACSSARRRSESPSDRPRAAFCARTRHSAACSATASRSCWKGPSGILPMPTICNPARSSGRSFCRADPDRASTKSVICAKMLLPSGSRSWGRWCATGQPIFDVQGDFKGYHGVGKDVTETARSQKALEESEQRYRMLFEVHPHPMWVSDNKTLAFLAVNQAAIRHYGYSREEFLSMTAEHLRPPRSE